MFLAWCHLSHLRKPIGRPKATIPRCQTSYVLFASSHLSTRVKVTKFSGLTQARSVETHKNALKADRHIKEMQVMKELSNFTLFNVEQLIALAP